MRFVTCGLNLNLNLNLTTSTAHPVEKHAVPETHPGLRSNYLRLPPPVPTKPKPTKPLARPQPQGSLLLSSPLLITPRSVAPRLGSRARQPARVSPSHPRSAVASHPRRRLPRLPPPASRIPSPPPSPTAPSAAGHFHRAPAPADRRRRARPPRLAAAQLVRGLQLASAQVCTPRVTFICAESSVGHFDGVCAITLNRLGGSVL